MGKQSSGNRTNGSKPPSEGRDKMKIIIITALMIAFSIIVIGGIINTRPRYYLVHYSYNYGEGSLNIERMNGGELDINSLLDYFINDKDIKGTVVIRSFQEISRKQYIDISALNERISDLKKSLQGKE